MGRIATTTAGFSLFPNGYLLCDHELDFRDMLMCEFNKSRRFNQTRWSTHTH